MSELDSWNVSFVVVDFHEPSVINRLIKSYCRDNIILLTENKTSVYLNSEAVKNMMGTVVAGQPIYQRKPTPGLAKEPSRPVPQTPKPTPVAATPKPVAAPPKIFNQQDLVLYRWQQKQTEVLTHLVDGRILKGQIKKLRKYSFVIGGILVMKTAIATVEPVNLVEQQTPCPKRDNHLPPNAWRNWYNKLTPEQKADFERKKFEGRARAFAARKEMAI